MIRCLQDMVPLGMVVLVALAARLLAMPFFPVSFLLDTPTYQEAASELMANGVMSNDFIMPLYPLLIGLFGGGDRVPMLIDLASGIISVVLVWALARCLFEDEKTGLVAALMMAIYPMAIFYSLIGLTESLSVALLLGAFLALYKNRPTLASVIFILLIMTRPTADIFAPVVIFWYVLVVRKAGFLLAIRHLAVYGVLYALLMAPWWYHNAVKHGSFVRLNFGYGVVLYAGNNPMNMSGGGIGGQDYDLVSFAGISDPVQKDQAMRDAAVEYIRQNPDRFFSLAFLKFARFWRVLPYAPQVRGSMAAVIATLSVLPVIVLAAMTLIARRRMFWYLTPVLGFVAYLTLVHMVTIGSVRYRFPLEPVLIVLAAPSLMVAKNYLFGKKPCLADQA